MGRHYHRETQFDMFLKQFLQAYYSNASYKYICLLLSKGWYIEYSEKRMYSVSFFLKLHSSVILSIASNSSDLANKY